jgi:protein-L-isoaspartate(D-aspartate) O-methyltransferase
MLKLPPIIVLLSLIAITIILVNIGCIRPKSEVKPQGNSAEEADMYKKARENMVKYQLESRGITDPAVLSAMGKVPREEFVPDSYDDEAYDDNPLPIGEGQTISQPYIVALMTELLAPQPTDKILEVGTGSGYQAAVLAEIVANVYTIEIIEELSKRARETCDQLGYKNISFKVGDGFVGWEEYAPFNGIIVTCAPGEVPQPLIDQLADGGHLVIPVGESYPQVLEVLTRKGDKIETEKITAVSFVPMTGKAQEK